MEFSLKSLQEKAVERGPRRMTSLLGLDFGASGIKAVRLNKTKGGVHLAAADILPATDPRSPERPDIPKPLLAYYASLCTSLDDSVVRVFNRKLEEGVSMEEVAREALNVSESHRIAVKVLDRQTGQRESSLLGTAMSDQAAQNFLELFSEKAPALHSMELAGLAAFSAFWLRGGRPKLGEVVCLIEGGARFTHVGFFYKNRPLLINRFSVGAEMLNQQVQKNLCIGADVAAGILSDGSVDVSGPVSTALGGFLKQLSVFREFVERQQKTHLSGVYLSGGLAAFPVWGETLARLLNIKPTVWNPFRRVNVSSELDLERFKGQEGRFAAAIGAALAGMEGGS